MSNMESLDKIDVAKVDPFGIITHVENTPKLILDGFSIAEKVTIPSFYIKAKKIVLLGMGGSGGANDVIKQLLLENTDLCVESDHNYSLPGFVDKETLVIACSYSGNTEETLAAFIAAYEKGAKLIAVTTGGKLEILAQKYRTPLFHFDYKCQPRASFPLQFAILLSIFAKLGYIELNRSMVDEAVDLLETSLNKYGVGNSLFSNPAKILAQKLQEKVPVIYGSEKLFPVAMRIKNMFNENAKNFAFAEAFPELNHNSLEGYLHPKDVHYVVSLESNFEQSRNILRQNLTAEIMQKRHVPIERVKFVAAKSWLSEILLMVMFGDFVSYYLAILNKANPGTNDAITDLKNKMA